MYVFADSLRYLAGEKQVHSCRDNFVFRAWSLMVQVDGLPCLRPGQSRYHPAQHVQSHIFPQRCLRPWDMHGLRKDNPFQDYQNYLAQERLKKYHT